MAEYPLPAETFATAVARVAAQRGRVVVVKLGGSAMEDPAATDACLKSVATLNQLGVPIVLVHGGGKPIDRAMAEAGLTPKKVAGRRYTDEATLQIVVRVLKEINASLIRLLQQLGCEAAAQTEQLHGERLMLSGPNQAQIDLGRVGKVTAAWANRNSTGSSAMAGCQSFPRWPSTPIAITSMSTLTPLPPPWRAHSRRTRPSFSPTRRACFATARPEIAYLAADRASSPRADRFRRHRRRDGAEGRGVLRSARGRREAALILDGRVPYSLLDVFLHDTFTGTAISR